MSETAARICRLRRFLTLSYLGLPIAESYIAVEANSQKYLTPGKPCRYGRSVVNGTESMVAHYSV
jgi:hypothetical protein